MCILFLQDMAYTKTIWNNEYYYLIRLALVWVDYFFLLLLFLRMFSLIFIIFNSFLLFLLVLFACFSLLFSLLISWSKWDCWRNGLRLLADCFHLKLGNLLYCHLFKHSKISNILHIHFSIDFSTNSISKARITLSSYSPKPLLVNSPYGCRRNNDKHDTLDSSHLNRSEVSWSSQPKWFHIVKTRGFKVWIYPVFFVKSNEIFKVKLD